MTFVEPGTRFGWGIASMVVGVVALSSSPTFAVHPNDIEIGKQIFMQDFAPRKPGIQGDGLGPLFNDTSCVACHQMGGVGGAGDVTKNARSLGLNYAVHYRTQSPEATITALAQFSPGFVNAAGDIQASFPLHRRGGSTQFQTLRDQSLALFNPGWNDDSTFACDDVHAERTPATIRSPDQSLEMQVHVFARNTTSLFGTGLIDQIPESALRAQVLAQRRDSEVSGRLATLPDGRIGKFGWRANFATLIDFNSSACANELGLQTTRFNQPRDILNRNYSNSNPDLDDDSVRALSSFVASLPRPQRILPEETLTIAKVKRGEQRFHAIGCAKCHVPHLGNVSDLYSDLLLHDMGPYSIDLAAAPPLIEKICLATNETQLTQTDMQYYGTTVTINRKSLTSDNSRLTYKQGNECRIVPPRMSPRTSAHQLSTYREEFEIKTPNAPPLLTVIEYETVAMTENEPTLYMQEWRTPPLWGLRHSAPYMHDGRAETVLEAIALHDGEGRGSRNRFMALSFEDQQAILSFLDTFAAPQQGIIAAPKTFSPRDLVQY